MKRFLTIIFLFSLAFSCNSQKYDDNLQWKEFISQEAGIKADFPCEIKKMSHSFQETSRSILYLGFYCQTKGMTFEVWSREHSEEFNSKTIQKTFEEREAVLKNMLGEVESFKEKKGFLTNGFDSKYYELKLKIISRMMNELIVVGKTKYYIVTFGFPAKEENKSNESKIDYESISKKFINSFQVLEN